MALFSDEELIIISVALDDENRKNEEYKTKRKRSIWVHPSLINRKTEGEYFTLYPHLVDDEDKFVKYFRMSAGTFEIILSKIEKRLLKKTTRFREAISPREKLVVCLRFLATGDSYRTIAFSYRLGHSTVQAIVLEVCQAINEELLAECIPTPQKENWIEIANDIWTMWNFPNCLGAIDGKHIIIDAPAKSGSLYFNYKKTFSIVLLALVDANYRFIAVDIGSYGKNSDGGIFANSNLGKSLDNEKLNVPEDCILPGTNTVAPYVILGDEAFPLKKYLMKPYPGAQSIEDIEKRIFNYRLCRARRLVECAFGILSQTFRIYYRRLKANPQNVNQIVLTTCILHNIIRNSRTIISDNTEEKLNMNNVQNLRRHGGNAQTEAFVIRNIFKDFFNSPIGSVPWQHDKI